jgi:hypothetical protein
VSGGALLEVLNKITENGMKGNPERETKSERKNVNVNVHTARIRMRAAKENIYSEAEDEENIES